MTTFIKFTLGFIILACVISSYQDSQKALARIDQMEQTVASIKSRGNQQGDFRFAASLDDRNRHDTWPDSVIVGKQYTAYVDEYAGPDAVTVGKQDSLTPVTVLIKGTIEEKQKIPVERALGDCWFCKKENLYEVMIREPAAYNTFTIDGKPIYPSWAVVQGMSNGPEKRGIHGGPEPQE